MSERNAETSPQMAARVTGALWLTCIVSGLIGFVAGAALILGDNAASTATNILAHESRFRAGFVADLISGLSYVGVTALLYHLLNPVSRSASFVAAFFGLGGVAIGGVGFVSQTVPLVLLHGGQSLGAFTQDQLQAMALLALKLRMQVFSISMVCFGVQCFLVGCLIVRSIFLPKLLGVLLAIGGSSYILISFLNFLVPKVGEPLTPFIFPLALIGEGSLTVWLLVKGVNVERWKQQAGAIP